MKAKKRRSGSSGDGSSLAKIEKTANGVKKEVEEDEETEKIHRAIDKTLLKNKTSRATKTEEVTGSNKSSSSIFTPKEIDGMAWKSFQCAKSELNLEIVLKCGQSFRWSLFRKDPKEYIGVLAKKVWILTQNDDTVFFKTIYDGSQKVGSDEVKKEESVLRDYFQLQVNLGKFYGEWSKVDPVFKDVSVKFSGVRMLRQDPVENTFSFICSANNNIQRISGMVESLCTNYGEPVATILNPSDGSLEFGVDKCYYAFPEIEALVDRGPSLEADLRRLGFGYRAAYIYKTAKQLQEKGGRPYLEGIREMPYPEAKAELLKLTGVGPKVADCILLMSLDQPSSVPVDTHMFQIAAQNYLPHLKKYKTVTDKVYLEIGDHFRKLYGGHAGWAHSVLFSADLRQFKSEGKTIKKEEKS